jgi:OOP family OmpA-OmpF porin
MAIFDSLIAEISSKFGLGAKSSALIAEVIRFMTSEPGGIAGFLERFKNAGLASLVNSWLGNQNPEPMSTRQVEQGLGTSIINMIAGKLGLGKSIIAPALGYAIPKLIGMLTPDKTIPSAIPATWRSFLDTSTAQSQAVYTEPARKAPGANWLWLLLPLLALLGVAWWMLSGREQPVATTAPASVATKTPAPVAQTAPTVNPRLGVNYHDSGYVTYSGVVKDEEGRTSIIDVLKGVFGAGNVKGDIDVDPNAAAAPWLVKLKEALENFKVPGLNAKFDGSAVNIGGLITESDRDRVIGSLQGLFGSGVSLGSMAENVNDSALAALNALRPGFSTNDVISALNLMVINFRTGTTDIPGFNRAVLDRAAAIVKQLPADTTIEIGGHTDNVGDEASNQLLSQQRAEAVRAVLIEAGVPQAMLIAKGYGGTRPKASNDTAEGRYQNRRIEFAVQ